MKFEIYEPHSRCTGFKIRLIFSSSSPEYSSDGNWEFQNFPFLYEINEETEE